MKLVTRHLPLALAAVSAILAGGCSGTPETSPTPDITPTVGPASDGDFTSAISGGPRNDAAEPPAAGSEEDTNTGDTDQETRDVAEADIFFVDGNTLYVLNTYRGLMAIDVTDPDHPRVLSRLALTGYPVEMYVREGRAYVVVSDYFYYWQVADSSTISSFNGSVVAIVDVENPSAMSLLGKIDLEGYVSQTRRVGDVLYAVSTRYAYYSCGVTNDTEDMTNVLSIDISDPSNPTQVDMVSWPGTWAQVHATDHSFYVVEPDYSYTDTGTVDVPADGTASGGSTGSAESPSGADPTPTATVRPGDPVETPVEPSPGTVEPTSKPDEPTTYQYSSNITYLDISDAGGIIKERDTISVAGQTWDKFALNEYNGTFRISTNKWDGLSSGTLTILDVSNPDEISQISSLDIVLPELESITATRFDGERGYVVTAAQTDPLFVVDLADPAAPRLAGHVEMPGQLNHLETNGDRIVAFGQDNSDSGTWRFAVSLFDVANMDKPALLDREIIGDGAYSWSSATWDDKSFSMLWNEGLIAVPFTAYTADWHAIGGVQLLDYSRDALAKRGIVSHEGYVTRVRMIKDRLASLSDLGLLMIDIEDRDAPRITADVVLTRNIIDYLPAGDIGIQLEGPSYYYYYDATTSMGRIRIVNASNPDQTDSALAEIEVPMYDGQLVNLGNDRIGLIRNVYNVDWSSFTQLDVFDISDPTAPMETASIELPSQVYSWASSYSMYYGSSGGALVQGDGYLAWLEGYYYWYGYPVEDTAEGGAPATGGRATPSAADEDTTFLYVVDVRNPDAPTVSKQELPHYVFGLKAYGSKLYASHAETFYDDLTNLSYARYYMDRVDVSNPAAPAPLASINVPGVFQHVLSDGTVVTMDTQYVEVLTPYGTSTEMVNSLKGVEIRNDRAYLLGTIPLETYSYSMMFEGNTAWMIGQQYWWTVSTQDSCYYYYSSELDGIELRFDSVKPATHSQLLPVSYAYLRGFIPGENGNAGGHLMVDTGYQGVLVYEVGSDPTEPAYSSYHRTNGYVLRVRSEGDTAYLPSGMYGVQQVDLNAGTSAAQN